MDHASPSLRAFRRAVSLVSEHHLADAAAAFRAIVEEWPSDDLADDALYNAGACYLAMNQYPRAIETFRDVIARYPNATIHDAGHGEKGRTAGKAWLGLVHAHLGLGDTAAARAATGQLESYADSTVTPAHGTTRTLHAIAQAILAEASQAPDADQITPADIVSSAD